MIISQRVGTTPPFHMQHYPTLGSHCLLGCAEGTQNTKPSSLSISAIQAAYVIWVKNVIFVEDSWGTLLI